MVHGSRVNIPKSAKRFLCVLCKTWFCEETPLVMFRNDNNREYAPGRVLWDCCCQPCAGNYISPPDPAKTQSTAPAGSSLIPAESGRHRDGAAPPAAPEGSPLVPAQQSETDKGQLFQLADDLGVPRWRAEQLLIEHGGDAGAAGLEILRILGLNIDEDIAAAEPAPLIVAPKPRREPAADQVMPRAQPAMPAFSTDEARQATASIFLECVAPLLPRPQRDGTLVGGDVDKLQASLATPIILSLSRAELRAKACRPADGWDEQSMLKARGHFLMEAVGLRFLLYMPMITHRELLLKHELFQVG